MVVTIRSVAARNRAIDWCTENLSSIGKWDCRLNSALPLYSSQWTYDFVFEAESDAVWFALIHGEHICQT